MINNNECDEMMNDLCIYEKSNLWHVYFNINNKKVRLIRPKYKNPEDNNWGE